MITADAQHVPVEDHQSFSERLFSVALRVGIAVGALTLIAANFLPDMPEIHDFDGNVNDPFLSEGDFE